MTIERAEEKIGGARLILRQEAPLMAGYLSLPMIVTERVKTASMTETGTMYLNPLFVLQHTVMQIVGLICHEYLHLFLDDFNPERLPEATPYDRNWVYDVRINPIVRDWGFDLPDTKCWPALYGWPEGETAESYYVRLLQLREDQRPNEEESGPANGHCGGVAGFPTEEETALEEASNAEQEELDDDDGDDDDAPGIVIAVSGGGGGEPSDASNVIVLAGGDDDDFETDPIAEILAAASRAVIDGLVSLQRNKLEDGIEKLIGTLPGDVQAEILLARAPKTVRWDREIAREAGRVIAQKQGNRPTYTSPHILQGGIGYGFGKPVLAKLVADKPEILIAIDSSGSMLYSPDLDRACAEVQNIIDAVGGKCRIVVIDTKIQASATVSSAKEARQYMKGGGGTNFIPLFEEIRKGKIRTRLVIMLTDGFATVPLVGPGQCRTIWALIGRYTKAPTEKWGKVVNVAFTEDSTAA